MASKGLDGIDGPDGKSIYRLDGRKSTGSGARAVILMEAIHPQGGHSRDGYGSLSDRENALPAFCQGCSGFMTRMAAFSRVANATQSRYGICKSAAVWSTRKKNRIIASTLAQSIMISPRARVICRK